MSRPREVRAGEIEVGDRLRLLSGNVERVTDVRPLNRAHVRIVTTGGAHDVEKYVAFEVVS